MKMKEIRDMSSDALKKKEEELRKEFGTLSFQHGLRPLEDTSRLKKIRKDIARIKTLKGSKAV